MSIVIDGVSKRNLFFVFDVIRCKVPSGVLLPVVETFMSHPGWTFLTFSNIIFDENSKERLGMS